MSELLERLGHDADDRVVIITSDGLGQSHASTQGCYRSIREGSATGATLMMPCSWARSAAMDYNSEEIGVSLTLNSEFDRYRWGPLTSAPSLLDGDGGFPRTVADMWDHADLDEVRRECRAQVERATMWGFNVVFLSNHLDALQMRPEFFDVYLDIAVELNLPIRLDGSATEATAGFRFRDLARAEGIISPDRVLRVEPELLAKGEPDTWSSESLSTLLEGLTSGVTELVFQPAVDSPELRAICEGSSQRVKSFEFLHGDSLLGDILNRAGAGRTTWSELSALMAS